MHQKVIRLLHYFLSNWPLFPSVCFSEPSENDDYRWSCGRLSPYHDISTILCSIYYSLTNQIWEGTCGGKLIHGCKDDSFGVARVRTVIRKWLKHVNLVQDTLQSSNAMLCASMCKTNSNCETYYLDSSQCHEGGALNLIGSLPSLPSAREVYIEQSVYASGKGKSTKTKGDGLYLDFFSWRYLDLGILVILLNNMWARYSNAYPNRLHWPILCWNAMQW